MKRLILCVALLLVVLPISAQDDMVDLSGIKVYAAENATLMAENSAQFLVTAQSYYDLLAGYDFDKIQAKLAADLVMEGEESGMKINDLHLLVNEDMALDVIPVSGWICFMTL